MKKIIQRLVSAGVDLSTKKALRAAVKMLGMRPENIDKLYVELKNDLHREKFKKIPSEKKIVFIPQCLRKTRTCKARMTTNGHECFGCSRDCQAFKIIKEARKKGYKAFIVPGSSMVYKLIKKHRPHAVLGIGCLQELSTAVEELKLPGQAVELMKADCVDSKVDLEEVFDIINHKKENSY